jgi:serine/threonine protein kinase
MHDNGWIYNDLKPDNIMVGKFEDFTKDHKIHLIDFGLCTPYIIDGKHMDK